jgi:hypothetical protein
MQTLPSFTIYPELCTNEQLILVDLGPFDRYPTITNRAQETVEFLTQRGYLWEGRRLFYVDSLGQLDEIEHDGRGEFKRFAPLTDQERAEIDPERALPRC